MKWLFRTAALAALAIASTSDVAHAASAADLSWLAGCWVSENAEPGSEEHWLAPAGGTLLGVSRTVQHGKTVAHEFLQIREIEPGQLVFIANPSGQAEAVFPLVQLTATEAVFENPRHDFPQRVTYRLSDGVLQASIEGKRDGKLARIKFPMSRAPCDKKTSPPGTDGAISAGSPRGSGSATSRSGFLLQIAAGPGLRAHVYPDDRLLSR